MFDVRPEDYVCSTLLAELAPIRVYVVFEGEDQVEVAPSFLLFFKLSKHLQIRCFIRYQKAILSRMHNIRGSTSTRLVASLNHIQISQP